MQENLLESEEPNADAKFLAAVVCVAVSSVASWPYSYPGAVMLQRCWWLAMIIVSGVHPASKLPHFTPEQMLCRTKAFTLRGDLKRCQLAGW